MRITYIERGDGFFEIFILPYWPPFQVHSSTEVTQTQQSHGLPGSTNKNLI